LREQTLFRGGRIQHLTDHADIANAASIISVRKGKDPPIFDANYLHFPISNDYEKYETADQNVKRWLTQIISAFCEDDFRWPAFVHCTSGKDRTGVVIAALLRICDVPDQVIIEEYLLSDGDVAPGRIQTALDGIGEPRTYFRRRVNLDAIRERLLV
jgi:protein-tyrosine phosphatase